MPGVTVTFSPYRSAIPARPAVPGTSAPTSILDAFKIGRQDQIATDNFNSDSRTVEEAYSPLLEAVNAARAKEGKAALNNPGKRSWARGPGQFSSTDYGFNPFKAGKAVTEDEQQKIIFAEIARLRGSDPAFLKGIADDPEKYLAGIYAAKGATARANAAKLQRGETGTGVASFVGAAAGSLQDPLTALSMPFGGIAKSLAAAFLKNGAINAAFGAAILPEVIENRAKIGQETSAGDIMTELVTDFVAGGALAAAGKYGGDKFDAWRNSPEVQQRAALKQILKHVPEDQRAAIKTIDDIPDELWPDITEGLIGKQNMTPDERAAVHVQRREAEIEAINPFLPNEPGKQAHHDGLANAMQAIIDGVPERPPVAPQAGRSRIRSELQGSTAISSRTVSATPAREQLKLAIGRVESGGSNTAKNALSSATGKYQFIRSTWVNYYKRRFGSSGLSDDQIAAKRSDPRLQDVLMDDLLSDNARFLRKAGQAETSGNLYLVHFAGQGGAERLFRADPNASALDVLGKAVVDANPFLAKMTARDVINWAHRKMGEGSPLGAGERTVLRDGENPLAQSLQAEIDRIEAAQAALVDQADAAFGDAPELGRAADDGAFDNVDPVFVDHVDEVIVPTDPAAVPDAFVNPANGRVSKTLAEAPPAPEVTELLPDVRAVMQESGDIITPLEIANRLNISEKEAKRVAKVIASDTNENIQKSGDGYVYTPVDPAIAARQAIDDAGGLSPDAAETIGDFTDLADIAVREGGMSIDAAAQSLRDAGLVSGPADSGVASNAASLAQALRRAEPVDLADPADLAGRADMAPGGDSSVIARTDFADPGGEAAQMVTDSVSHDLKVDLKEMADGAGFRLEEDGQQLSFQDILDEFDSEEAVITAVEGCL